MTSDLRTTYDLLTYDTSVTLRDIFDYPDPDDDPMAWIRH
jgi:hypothetical protein